MLNFYVTYCSANTKTVGGSTVTANANNCDFQYYNASGTVQYRFLTAQGRYWNKILNGLGYTIPSQGSQQTTSTWYTTVGAKKLSALPFLAFLKAYNDWMSQSQRYNTSNLTAWLKGIKHKKGITGYQTSDNTITAAGINYAIQEVKLNYENDYFTSAWRYPNSPVDPISAGTGLITADVPALNGNSVGQFSYDNILSSEDSFTNTSSDPWNTLEITTTLGQRALDFLKSFDDWVRRNNYSGSRAVQKVYSRFGIKTDDYRSNYAHVIKTDSNPIQVGDVTATADTTNAVLGDYAGKGFINSGTGFSFDAKEYGLLMILGYITVTPMNAYGFDRMVLRNKPLDYYNPEFDGIGGEAISAGEFFANPLSSSSETINDDSVFGFTERYNSYRFGRDKITGDFRNYHEDSDMNTWHTGRLLNSVRSTGNLVAQGTSVNTLSPTGTEYNRIFSQTDNSVDHFYMTAQFDVSAVRPMKSLNEVPRLGEGDTQVPRNGNVIS